MIRILGIDPGSRVAGYGIVDIDQGQILHVEHGTIDVSKIEKFEDRLRQLGEDLARLIIRVKPQESAVEKVFLGKNPDSAFKLGHARGVCLYELSRAKIRISEYSTRTVKMGVTGSGGSTKEIVQKFVFDQLKVNLKENSNIKLDASDALALALHHGKQFAIEGRLRAARI